MNFAGNSLKFHFQLLVVIAYISGV